MKRRLCGVVAVLAVALGHPFSAGEAFVPAEPPLADVYAVLTGSPVPVVTGGTYSYTLEVGNEGPGPATDVVATLTLPPGAIPVPGTLLVSPGGFCTLQGTTYTWTMQSLAVGQSSAASFQVTAPQAPVVLATVATVTAAESDPDPTDNSAVTVVPVVQPPGDLDGDGVPDETDAFPADPAASVDTDGDGKPDAWNAGATPEQIAASQLGLDLDDDNDGLPDAWESLHGLNPLDRGDAALDPDGDGLANLREYELGTNPRLAQATAMPGPLELLLR